MVKFSKEERNVLGEAFSVTSVCREDILQTRKYMVHNEKEEVEMIKKVLLIDDSDMMWIASKLADQFCGCCFWEALEDRVEQVLENKEKECTKKKKKQ